MADLAVPGDWQAERRWPWWARALLAVVLAPVVLLVGLAVVAGLLFAMLVVFLHFYG